MIVKHLEPSLKISELSRASEVPIPTIKFYLREGALAPGVPTSRTQADYTDDHLRRLRLIRTLTEIGGLSLRQIRDVLAAIDTDTLSTHDMLGIAHHALGPFLGGKLPGPDDQVAQADVDGFLGELGWQVSPDAPARRVLTSALATLRQFGRAEDVGDLEPYARLADELSRSEVANVPRAESRAAAVEFAVVGTVVFEAVLLAMRRLAQEHHSAVRFRS